MPRGVATVADTQFLSQLARAGIDAHGAPITLEQLQSWRARGLIDDFTSVSVGRGGRVSHYGPTARDQVRDLVRMISLRNNIHAVTLWSFGAGRNPKEKYLRAAFDWSLRRDAHEAKRSIDNPRQTSNAARTLFGESKPLGPLDPLLRTAYSQADTYIDPATGETVRLSAAQRRREFVGDIAGAVVDGRPDANEFLNQMMAPELAAHMTGLPIDELERLRALADIQSGPMTIKSIKQRQAFIRTLTYNQLVRWRDWLSVLLGIFPNPMMPSEITEDDRRLWNARLVPQQITFVRQALPDTFVVPTSEQFRQELGLGPKASWRELFNAAER